MTGDGNRELRGCLHGSHRDVYIRARHTHHTSHKDHFLPQTLQYAQMCLCLFVLCHLAAPDESENVAQSDDETENGTLLSQSLLSE